MEKHRKWIGWGVWNEGNWCRNILNIETDWKLLVLGYKSTQQTITARLHRASMKERKTRGRSRCFLSREIILLLQYSRGKDLLLSFVPNAMTIFLSPVLISFTSPMKKPCSKQGLQLATAILNSTTQYASSAQNLWLNLSTIMLTKYGRQSTEGYTHNSR